MFIKKISNLLSSTNIIVALSLVAILLLVYLKDKNYELFGANTPSTNPITTSTVATTIPGSTIPATTIPLLNNDIINNSALVNFINRYIVNKNQQQVYSSTLSGRQSQINNLSKQVVNLINPSV